MHDTFGKYSGLFLEQTPIGAAHPGQSWGLAMERRAAGAATATAGGISLCPARGFTRHSDAKDLGKKGKKTKQPQKEAAQPFPGPAGAAGLPAASWAFVRTPQLTPVPRCETCCADFN